MATTDRLTAFDEAFARLAHGLGPEQEAAEQVIAALACDESMVARVRAALQDGNENVRIAAAKVPGLVPGFDADVGLLAVLRDGTPAVRRAAARSLGRLGRADAIVPLRDAVLHGPSNVPFDAAAALVEIPGGAAALAEAAGQVHGSLRGAVVKLLGDSGDAAAEPAVRAALFSDDLQASRAAAGALPKIVGAAALGPLAEVLANDRAEPKLRARVATELGALGTADAVPALIRALLVDRDRDVWTSAADALALSPAGVRKVDALLECLLGQQIERGDLPVDHLTRALSMPDTSDFGAAGTLVAALIERALGRDARVTSCLAVLIVGASGGSAEAAGSAINDLQAKRSWTDAELQALRIDVGGQVALDPLLRQLRLDLERYFQEPVHKLNQATQDGWERTIDSAHQGFRARLVMSIVVFVVGILLIAASAVMFFSGAMEGDALWGVGVSFVSGLATMLAVTYTGPLKDIRTSVSDLGAASAAFIGYIHQVLQISHTFTALYMRDRITFAEMETSNRLIDEARAATVASLVQAHASQDAAAKPGDPARPEAG